MLGFPGQSEMDSNGFKWIPTDSKWIEVNFKWVQMVPGLGSEPPLGLNHSESTLNLFESVEIHALAGYRIHLDPIESI